MFNLGVPELILILIVGIVVFGPKKLPEVGSSVGKALREFKKAMNDIKQNIDIQAELQGVTELKNEAADTKSGHEEIHQANGEDIKTSWISNSPEWVMPEFAAQAEGVDNWQVSGDTEGHNTKEKPNIAANIASEQLPTS